METATKKVGATLGAVVLVGGATMGAVPAMGVSAEAYAADVELQTAEKQSVAEATAVQGEFTYTQDAVTDMGIFAKAAAAACSSMLDYAASCAHVQINVRNGVDQYVMQVGEGDDMRNVIIGCACSSNIAGGGAIGNAEVSGVTLESVAAQVGAL